MIEFSFKSETWLILLYRTIVLVSLRSDIAFSVAYLADPMSEDFGLSLVSLRLRRQTAQKVIGALPVLHDQIETIAIDNARLSRFSTSIRVFTQAVLIL